MVKECEHPGCGLYAYKTGLCNAHYIRKRRGKSMAAPVRKVGADPERFWQKVCKSDGCWEWQAYKDPAGYGRFMIDRVPQLAHRVSFEMTNGPIPVGHEVDHACHNAACVKPAHLRLATSGLNKQNRAGATRVSRSGIRGVRQCDSGRWSAEAVLNGQRVYLGRFDSADEASAAISEWRRENMPYSLMDQRKEP